MGNLNNKFQKRELALYKTYRFLIQNNHDSNYEEAYRNVKGLVTKKEFAKIYNEAQKYASVYFFFKR